MDTPAQILIVEDDAILATELQETLSKMGYQISGLAATGKSAVESALAQKPDILLMDIRLRGAMTGIQAVGQIHQQLDIPVVYLTAFADEAFLQQAKITDAYAYLVKPVREHELRAGLEMALYKHAAEQRFQHLNQILRAVRDVNQLITREQNAQHLVDEACQILLRAHGYRFVWIGQAAGDRLKPLAHAGEGQALLRHIVASATPEQGLKLPGTEAARTRRVVVCHDMLNDERYAPWQQEVNQTLFSSTVAIPILHEDSLFGVISVYSDQTNIFGAEEIDLLSEMAGDIAFGLKSIARETERKQAEEALRESEQKHRTLFESMSQGVIYYNTSEKIISANPSAERMLGLSFDQLQGKTFLHKAWKLIREDGSNLPDQAHPVALALRTGKSVEHTILGVFNPNTNATIWLSLSAIPLFNPNEKEPYQVYATFEDITERKLDGEKLRKSEALFRAVVEHNHDGIVLMDAERRPFYVSPSYTQISGYSPEEWIGRYGPDFVHPDDREIAANVFREVLQSPGGMARATYRVRHKMGHWFWVETNATNLLHDSVIRAVVLNSRDITARKLAEDALHESNNQMEMAQIIGHTGSWVFNFETGKIWGTVEAHRIFGYAPVAGDFLLDDIESCIPERERVHQALINLIRTGQEYDLEYEIQPADGSSPKIIHSIARLEKDAKGTASKVSGFIQDVTELKRAEEDRMAREIAERANRAKSEFISRMSHELRTPLNAILGFSQLLKMGELKPNQARDVEQIYKSGRHLLTLVNEVLDIARIESGKLHIAPEPVQLEEALRDAIELIQPLASARRISISQEILTSADIWVQADRQSFRQVLLNLFSNAVKYNREGGEIAISTSLTIDGHMRLQVRDTGEGIPPDKMERLFVPFDRLGMESIEQEGTGLGLALSKGLVEAMGGRIGASSRNKPGEGSIFWLELKLATERLTETILAEVDGLITSQMRSERGLVLYIEDNLPNVKLVEAIMERLPQVKMITALQGRLALDLAKEHKPDLILLDLHLPDMLGSEVLRQLKAEPVTQKTPVIIISANAMPMQIDELLAAGARTYLTKPIDIKNFLKVVEDSLMELPKTLPKDE